MFAKYHYLTHDINKGADCYIATVDDVPVSFCSVIHFPHPKIRNLKHIHRVVTLPDYQGIGIAKKLLNEVARIYTEKGFKITLISSSLAMKESLLRNQKWVMVRKGTVGAPGKNTSMWHKKDNSISRITFTFQYIG